MNFNSKIFVVQIHPEWNYVHDSIVTDVYEVAFQFDAQSTSFPMTHHNLEIKEFDIFYYSIFYVKGMRFYFRVKVVHNI